MYEFRDEGHRDTYAREDDHLRGAVSASPVRCAQNVRTSGHISFKLSRQQGQCSTPTPRTPANVHYGVEPLEREPEAIEVSESPHVASSSRVPPKERQLRLVDHSRLNLTRERERKETRCEE